MLPKKNLLHIIKQAKINPSFPNILFTKTCTRFFHFSLGLKQWQILNLHKMCKKIYCISKNLFFIILDIFKQQSQFSRVQTAKNAENEFFSIFMSLFVYSVLHNLKGLPDEYDNMTYFTLFTPIPTNSLLSLFHFLDKRGSTLTVYMDLENHRLLAMHLLAF